MNREGTRTSGCGIRLGNSVTPPRGLKSMISAHVESGALLAVVAAEREWKALGVYACDLFPSQVFGTPRSPGVTQQPCRFHFASDS